MSPTLQSLPFDILVNIASYIDINEITHLSQVSPALAFLIEDPFICRSAIESWAPFSQEWRQYKTGLISAETAFNNLYQRRSAVGNGKPLSVTSIRNCSSFVYRNGWLAFSRGNQVFVRNVKGNYPILDTSGSEGKTNNKIPPGKNGCGSLPAFYEAKIPRAWEDLNLNDSGSMVELVGFNNNVLTLCCRQSQEGAQNASFWLLAMRVSANDEENVELFRAALPSTEKLFVRHNQSYIFWGTQSGRANHEYLEWVIKGTSFQEWSHAKENGNVPRMASLQLADFVGSDMGSTCTFEIHDGHLYGVSNQTSWRNEEIDWTSLFDCICFPLAEPYNANLKRNKRIYRRQHDEGPLDDLWTGLSLQVREDRGELTIVEGRREWTNGGSSAYRTFYTADITFSDAEEPQQQLPANDPYATIVTSANRPTYVPRQKLMVENAHPEREHPGYRSNPPFIAARTKYRSYNLASAAFIDLVSDNTCCQASSKSMVGCLRLRTGSRRLGPFPPDWNKPPDEKGKGRATEPTASPRRDSWMEMAFDDLEDSDEQTLLGDDAQGHCKEVVKETEVTIRGYTYSPISLWPPPLPRTPNPTETTPSSTRPKHDIPASMQALHRLMNPHHANSDRFAPIDITAASDERMIAFLVRKKQNRSAASGYEAGHLILVSFCPWITDREAEIHEAGVVDGLEFVRLGDGG